MPIYEYHCHKCDEVFQVKQKIHDEKLTTHERCGGELERLISSTSFVLKGTGWYKTDYAGGASAKAAGSESGGESKSASSGDGHGCGATCGCA